MYDRVSAIVLKRSISREHDTLLAVFTRERGKLKILVRGAMLPTSKLAFLTLPLTENDMLLVQGRNFPILIGGKRKTSYTSISNDVHKFLLAEIAVDVLLKTSGESDPHPGGYEAMRGFLSWLMSARLTVPLPLPLYCFITRLLAAFGWLPESSLDQGRFRILRALSSVDFPNADSIRITSQEKREIGEFLFTQLSETTGYSLDELRAAIPLIA
jgi:DNA repair protein RecO